jgi:hypothetical protein
VDILGIRIHCPSTAFVAMMLSEIDGAPTGFDGRLEAARGRLDHWGHGDCAE